MEQYDMRVDEYINNSPEFARPILMHIREVVHRASPLIMETIKWGCPFFDYKGAVCSMAAFKQHCALGFWKASLLNDPQQFIKSGEASAGSFGRIVTLEDLPGDDIIIDFVTQSIELNQLGAKVPAAKKPEISKAELEIPEYFSDLLDNNPAAGKAFERFSPSHQREYVLWITEAKTEATRQKRMQTALEWITDGKPRHWKYQ